MGHNTHLEWAAGLFEGEGCFAPVTFNGRVYPRAILAMTDEEVVLRFQRVVECGHIRLERRAPARKDLFRWEVQARHEFDRFAEALLPLLGTRRREAYAQMMERVTPRERKPFTRKRKE